MCGVALIFRQISCHLATPLLSLPQKNVDSFSTLPPPSIGDAAVLTAPRPTFGQAVSSFLKGIADKFKEVADRLRSKLNSVIQKVSKPKRDADDPPSDPAPKQEETAALKSGTQEQRDEKVHAVEQKPPVMTAAAPRKSFSQGLDDLAKRSGGKSSAKPPSHDITDHKHHK